MLTRSGWDVKGKKSDGERKEVIKVKKKQKSRRKEEGMEHKRPYHKKKILEKFENSKQGQML